MVYNFFEKYVNYWFLVICWLFLPYSMLLAQVSEIDSLKKMGDIAYLDGEYEVSTEYYLQRLALTLKDPSLGVLEELQAKTDLGDVYRKQRLFQQSLMYYDEVIARIDTLDEDTYLQARQNRAIVYYLQNEPIKAINENIAILPRTAAHVGRISIDYGSILMNLGSDYQETGDYFKAEQMFLKSLATFKEAAPPNSKYFNRIYNNLGINYDYQGDYPKALEFTEKALEVKLKNYEPDHPSVGKYYMNLGSLYLDIGQAKKALPLMEQALAIDHAGYGENHPYTIQTRGQLAVTLMELGRYDEALTNLRKVQDMDTRFEDAERPFILSTYNTIAEIYQKQGNLGQAISIQKQTIERLEKLTFIPPAVHAEMLDQLADFYLKKKDLPSALETLFRGVQSLIVEDENAKKFPANLPDREQVVEHKIYLNLLQKIAQIYEQQAIDNTDATSKLLEALAAIENAIETIKWLRTTYHSKEARQYLNNETSGIFKQAVRVAYRLYQLTGDYEYLKKAFFFSESAKADILRHSVNEGLALRSVGIPEILLDSLDGLSFKIGAIEEELQNELIEYVDSQGVIDSLKSIRFTLREAHSQLIKSIEKDYPKYYALKFGQKMTDLALIQQQLNTHNTQLISYFYDEENVYIFVVSAEKLIGFQMAHHGQLRPTIEACRRFLTPKAALEMDPAAATSFHTNIIQLYNWLIQPCLPALRTDTPIVIVPVGILHYLPFEVLYPEQKTTNFRTSDYLINKHPIYYAISADLWASEHHRQAVGKYPFIGFAPQYKGGTNASSERGNYAPLRWNLTEVATVQSLLGGKIFVDTVATEEQFRIYAPNADNIHLAMHASVDDEVPMRSGLIFNGGADTTTSGLLQLHEIYNLDLSAETIVMSACNTGYGKLAAGEGVLSLSHAFRFAGGRNILYNLWLADDEVASQIVIDFYKYLETGLSKERALQQAKLDYLEQADPLRAHPYFWAGLVLQGEGHEQLKTIVYWYWAGGLFLIFGLMLWQLRACSEFNNRSTTCSFSTTLR